MECFSLFIDNAVIEKLVLYINIYITKVKLNFPQERDAKETNNNKIRASIMVEFYTIHI